MKYLAAALMLTTSVALAEQAVMSEVEILGHTDSGELIVGVEEAPLTTFTPAEAFAHSEACANILLTTAVHMPQDELDTEERKDQRDYILVAGEHWLSAAEGYAEVVIKYDPKFKGFDYPTMSRVVAMAIAKKTDAEVQTIGKACLVGYTMYLEHQAGTMDVWQPIIEEAPPGI